MSLGVMHSGAGWRADGDVDHCGGHVAFPRRSSFRKGFVAILALSARPALDFLIQVVLIKVNQITY